MSEPHPVLLMVRELGVGGCERDAAKMARFLDRRRFSPHVGCLRPNGIRTAELAAAGVPITTFPLHSLASPAAVWRAVRAIRRYLKEHRIEVVHAYDFPMSMFGAPVARMCGAPVVISSNLGYRDKVAGYTRELLFAADRLSDAVVVNSRAVQEHLVAYTKMRPEKTYLCYNGVETAVFYPKAEPRPEPVRDAALVIGAVCALREEKRLDLLLEAFSRVQRRREGLKLLIVGSGNMLPRLEAQSARLGLGETCHFEPETADVAPWMRAIDVFVLCSSTESFPNALLEAMACGCCVIGSRVGGVPELIENGVSGLVFEPGDIDSLVDRLTTVVDNDELRRSMGQAAAKRAREEFSMEIAAQRTGALYEELLRRRNRRASAAAG